MNRLSQQDKTVALPATDAGKRVYLDFDGVMAMATVYVNGQQAGDEEPDTLFQKRLFQEGGAVRKARRAAMK